MGKDTRSRHRMLARHNVDMIDDHLERSIRLVHSCLELDEVKAKQLLDHLRCALVLLRGPQIEPSRNLEWFDVAGHLNEAGIAKLHGLFEEGLSAYAAGQQVGISYSASEQRYKRWKKALSNSASFDTENTLET